MLRRAKASWWQAKACRGGLWLATTIRRLRRNPHIILPSFPLEGREQLNRATPMFLCSTKTPVNCAGSKSSESLCRAASAAGSGRGRWFAGLSFFERWQRRTLSESLHINVVDKRLLNLPEDCTKRQQKRGRLCTSRKARSHGRRRHTGLRSGETPRPICKLNQPCPKHGDASTPAFPWCQLTLPSLESGGAVSLARLQSKSICRAHNLKAKSQRLLCWAHPFGEQSEDAG